MLQAILCIGAAHVDVIARASAPLAPGADVPGRVEQRPGGVAANVALALAEFGRPAMLLAAVGRDAAGDRLVAELRAAGVDCDLVLRHDGPTDRYVAIESAAGEVFAAVADCAGLERADTALLRPLIDGRLDGIGQVVLDGNLPAALIEAIAGSPALAATPFALVPASAAKAARLGPVLGAAGATLYLNRREAEAICGRSFADSRAAALGLRHRGVAAALVTDGAAAATLASGDLLIGALPPPVATRSLTGAGDRLVAAHLAAVAEGLPPEAALRAALAGAARHIARAAS